MILPKPGDLPSLALLLDQEGGLCTFKLALEGICNQRGVMPIAVELGEVERPRFELREWRIVLREVSAIDLLHEVAHAISIMDEGVPGSEADAETFAHGVSMWLWPELYEEARGLEWFDVEERETRRILWTRDYLERTRDSWKKASTSGF